VYGSFRPEKKIIATRDALEQTLFNDSNHNRLLWEKEFEKDESLFMSLKLLRPNRGYKPNSKLNIGYLGKYYTNNKNDTYTDFVINKSSRDSHKFQEKSGHWRTKTCKKASSPILKCMMSFLYPKKISMKSTSDFFSMSTLPGFLKKNVVWLLLGGETVIEDSSLMSGIHIYLNLRNLSGIRIELFFISPLKLSNRNKERQNRTLNIRNKQLLLGLPHYMIDDVFHKTAIKRPAQLGRISLSMLPIWAVPFSLALCHSSFEIHNACEQWCEIHTKSKGFLEDKKLTWWTAIDLHKLNLKTLKSESWIVKLHVLRRFYLP
jgi:hypothetical protein